ncbi:MAG: 4Fe-4S binding protein [Deltaproteobacteria bacterium]|nr:4Fe-4S binding protein [Deltaproteobacteria bacterium]
MAALILWLYGEHWRPLRLSTWRFMREAGIRRFLDFSALHAYVYGRWIKEYIYLLINHILPRLKPRGKKWWSDRYHGKVVTQEQAEAIITIDQNIPLRDLEQIIPYPMARDLVLKGPPDVAVIQCGCRQARDNPCKPVQVCMVIGQPFVDFMLEHHPQTSRRLTQVEALELLKAEHKRGHLHSAWFKDAMLDRFYAICNCCKCCCGGIEAMVKYGAPMLAASGYVAQVDETLCEACATCVDTCPFDSIQVNGLVIVNWETCMGCGVCVGQCPNEAMSLIRDERKGIPLDVRLLSDG